LGDIPLSHDFQSADRLLKKVKPILAGLKKKKQKELTTDLLELMVNATSLRPRFAASLPKDIEGLEVATEDGTAKLSVPNRVRSIEWLEKNGRCLDNIRPDRSTIPQAGRGAFATRRIRQGEIIAPMPVVHLRRQHMQVYDADDATDDDPEVWYVGEQQLLNYCFGEFRKRQ
jgi:hypothetical protein